MWPACVVDEAGRGIDADDRRRLRLIQDGCCQRPRAAADVEPARARRQPQPGQTARSRLFGSSAPRRARRDRRPPTCPSDVPCVLLLCVTCPARIVSLAAMGATSSARHARASRRLRRVTHEPVNAAILIGLARLTVGQGPFARGSGVQMAMSLGFLNWPLRAKMAALLVAASLLPLAISAYIDLRQTQTRLFDGMKSLLEARGDQIVHELEASIATTSARPTGWRDFPSPRPTAPRRRSAAAAGHAAMLGILSAYPASDTGIRGAALLDGSGRIVIATETPLTGIDLSDRPIVQAALQGTRGHHRPFHLVARKRVGTDDRLLCTDARPRRGGSSCVAVLWVRATALWEHRQSLQRPGRARAALRCCSTAMASESPTPTAMTSSSAPEASSIRRRSTGWWPSVGSAHAPERCSKMCGRFRSSSSARARHRPTCPSSEASRPATKPGTTGSRAASRRCRGRCSTWSRKPASPPRSRRRRARGCCSRWASSSLPAWPGWRSPPAFSSPFGLSAGRLRRSPAATFRRAFKIAAAMSWVGSTPVSTPWPTASKSRPWRCSDRETSSISRCRSAPPNSRKRRATCRPRSPSGRASRARCASATPRCTAPT